MKLYIKSSLSEAEEQAMIEEEMAAIERGNFDSVRNKNIYKAYEALRSTDSKTSNMFLVDVENKPTVKDSNGYIHQYDRASYSRWPVASIEEAQDAIRFFIKNKNLGGSEFTGGNVYDASGNLVAKISYNGRIEYLKEPTEYLEHTEESLDTLADMFKDYLLSNDAVEDCGIDIIPEDGLFCITIVLKNGKMIDDWDEDLFELPVDTKEAFNYLVNKFNSMI